MLLIKREKSSFFIGTLGALGSSFLKTCSKKCEFSLLFLESNLVTLILVLFDIILVFETIQRNGKSDIIKRKSNIIKISKQLLNKHGLKTHDKTHDLAFETGYNTCNKIDIQKPDFLLHKVHGRFSDVCRVILVD